MITGNGEWSAGYWIAIVAIIVTLTIAAGISLLVLIASQDGEEAIFGLGTTWVVALFLAVQLAIGCYPFDGAHHKYYDVHGTVQQVDKRLLSNGDNGMSERYVVKFAESETLYGCDDTRCSLANVGKELHLKCKREWQYKGQDGWVCSYNQES